MIRRVLSFFSKASFWGVVLMLLGLTWAVLWLGIGQPNVVCSIAEGLLSDPMANQAHASVVAHLRIRQSFSGWLHDDGWWVGEIAGKDDVPSILDTDSTNYFDNCSTGHRGVAMSLITNHSLEEGTRDAWQKWWDEHKHQTQAEWMMAGFKAEGIEFTLPLDKPSCQRLLKLIGRHTKERERRFKTGNSETSLPDHIITNLHRVLYFQNAQVVSVTKEDLAADPSGELLLGFIAVLRRSDENRLFHNPFEEPQRPFSHAQLTGILNPLTPWIHWAIPFALFQAGFFLWLRARFKRQGASDGVAHLTSPSPASSPGAGTCPQ